jgi:hypothetical protein
MKPKPFALAGFVLCAALCAVAQTGQQKSFEARKSLAGTWTGKNSMGGVIQILYRPTSGGSALLERNSGGNAGPQRRHDQHDPHGRRPPAPHSLL